MKFKKTKKYINYKKKKSFRKKKIKNPYLLQKVGYLYKNQKLNIGLVLNPPKSNQIKYPFYMNLKLINEAIKK